MTAPIQRTSSPTRPMDAPPPAPLASDGPSLPEPLSSVPRDLSDALSEVYALLGSARSTDLGGRTSDAAKHKVEREEARERMQKALEDAKEAREDAGFWGFLSDVLEIGAVAASALATVATCGASAPVLLGVAASVFSQVESKTHVLEELGVDEGTAQSAVLGANLLSIGLMTTGSLDNVVKHGSDVRVYVSEGLSVAGEAERKLGFIESALQKEGSTGPIFGTAFGLASGPVAQMFSVGRPEKETSNLEGIAGAIGGGSKVGAGLARLVEADQSKSVANAELDAEREKIIGARAASLEEQVIDDMKNAVPEWERALSALSTSLRELEASSLTAARLRG